MSTRTTVTDGKVSQTTDAEAPRIYSGDTPVSFPASVRFGGVKTRVVVDTDTGATRILENAPSGYVARPVSERGAVVRNAAGMSIPLVDAQPSDVVDLPGIGTTSVASAVNNGWLRPNAGGRGYQLPGAPEAQQAQQQAPEQQQQQDNPKGQVLDSEPNPADLRGVPGTSASSDATLARLQREAPAAFEGVIESIARGQNPAAVFEDAGRQLRDENFVAKAQAMHGEFIASGRQVLKNAGVSERSFPASESWARDRFPEATSDAARDMVSHRSVAKLANLGRRFVEESNTKLATLIQAKGVDTRVENGAVWVKRSGLGLGPTRKVGDFGNSDWSPLADMIREGHIEIA